MLYTSPGVLGANAIPEILITADGYNVDLSVLAREHGWNGVSPFKARVIVQAGVKIGSTTKETAGLFTGSLTSTSQLYLTNNGTIAGKGGNAVHGNRYAISGGPALQTDCLMEIDNASGLIGGGGGGGAAGGGGTHASGAIGGAGAGHNPGAGHVGDAHGGGDNSHTAVAEATLMLGSAQGTTGSEEGGRRGGSGLAGRGGDLGQPGSPGTVGNTGSANLHPPGAAGAAIIGITRVTFTARGDIRGVTM